MRYLVLSCRVADHATADALAETLLAAGHHALACSDDPAGGVEAVYYAPEGTRPTAIEAAMAAVAITDVSSRLVDETELVEAPDAECWPLTRGVSVVADARVSVPDAELRLVVPPGPAFGDGRHPSTRMAADCFGPDDVAARRVLDLGCGSGALGVLAARWGAAAVVLADLDPDSVRCAETTWRANLDGRPDCRQGDLLEAIQPGESFDLVLANLYYDLLLRLVADRRLEVVCPQGVVVCSGVGFRHAPAVIAAFEGRDWVLERRFESGWWQAQRWRRKGCS